MIFVRILQILSKKHGGCSWPQVRWATNARKTSKRYSETLNLPKTTFPLTMKDGVVPKRELAIQESCEFDELYSWQRENRQTAEEFILHDGPPYANGAPHVGHALNKILKDITLRYQLLRGRRLHYIPGWDCHGLPIEQKALANIKKDHRELPPQSIRKTAKKFAEKTIKKQLAAFKRWGVLADWKNCYYTFDKNYEATQLEVFHQIYEKGFIYQDYMPVYWSPSSRTALAEAELEYNEQHISPAVYVKFPLRNCDALLPAGIEEVSCVIWTTTPWTLPANKAICYSLRIKYSLVRNLQTDETYLISTESIQKLSALLNVQLEELQTVEGIELHGVEYLHPLTNKTQKLLPASHVTVDKGTGLVHTAPSHGQEDFQVATQQDLPVDCIVDEDGKFTSEAGPQLAGLYTLDSGNDKVLELMESDILHQEPFTHSYPYDWRTKQPVLIRASKQWFVNTSRIKDRALELLNNEITILPKSSGQGMLSQLNLRTYWCISRQRVWGVPIPVFYHKSSGQPLLTRASIDHLKGLVKEHGTDCWWTLPLDQLLPPSVLSQSGFPADAEFEKGEDVLDIWFDSGVSWANVLQDCQNTADVYMEGLDQFGGWFQSSLLTRVAAQDKAPYKNLVVHGFAMDEEGKKMSKSVGNVVDPDIVVNGGKNREQNPAYGADVLRWWVARSDFDSKVHIGPNILQQCNEQLFRLRKTLRYLVGNLFDFEPAVTAVPYNSIWPQDKYMLHLLYDLTKQVTQYYDQYQYLKVLTSVEKFMNTHTSIYIHMTKDRLYCESADDVGRRSAQTVQWLLLEALIKFMAPVVPHLAEEVYQHVPYDIYEDSVFKTPWFTADESWSQADLVSVFAVLFSMRNAYNSVLESDQSLHFDVVLCADDFICKQIQTLQGEVSSAHSLLTEVLQCSQSSIMSDLSYCTTEARTVDSSCVIPPHNGAEGNCDYRLVITPATGQQCERCRRYPSPSPGELCHRCTEVLAHGWDQ